MSTFYIHINGIIPGAEIQLTLQRMAREMRVNGYAENVSDGFDIYFNADSLLDASNFLQKIKQTIPEIEIIPSQFKKIADTTFVSFHIKSGDGELLDETLIPADKAICDACRSELNDPASQFAGYPFISCAHCGPRYSITKDIPFNRDNTSMQHFSRCHNCEEAYRQIHSHHFHAETGSCAICGIKLGILCGDLSVLSKNTDIVFSLIKHFLNQGKILAVKSTGGYILMCDADNVQAIQLLRKRKHCPGKPFAILYPDMEAVEHDFFVNNKERNLLKSEQAPEVLLYPKEQAGENLAINNIAPGLSRVGVMIPATPLLELIAQNQGKPIAITSANLSGSPIIYKDEDANLYLFDIVDFIVNYNLEVVVPQDDSIVQFSKYENQQIILRRSLRLAPSFPSYQFNTDKCILAIGSSLESTFTLAINNDVFVSQYLGDTETYDAQLMYKNTLWHWLNMLNTKPGVIITDNDTGCFSHKYAAELAKDFGADVRSIQHHEAHFAAVLAENELLHHNQPVLGIIWDGGGMGYDDNIWGGEFFKYENNEMMRCYHFDYYAAIASHKLMAEPRIAALCIAGYNWPQTDILQDKFTTAELNKYVSLSVNTNVYSSSAGSIFNAVASLLNLCDMQTYESEAAMYLQVLAEEYVKENGFVMNGSYFKTGEHYYRIPTLTLMHGVIADIYAHRDKKYIAAKFYYSMVGLVGMAARQMKVADVCFSGDVFQNALLVDWIKREYKDKYHLYFHVNLSSNNENISFGQMVHYENGMRPVFTAVSRQSRCESEKVFVR